MKTKMKFKEYLLTESKQFLADRVKDTLEGVEDLISAGKQLGARQLLRNSESVVNQIRKILHQSWSRTEYKHLRVLQKCGVAIMKTIDDKGDLRETLTSVRKELLNLLKKLGVPVSKAPEPEPEEVPPGQPPEQQQPPPGTPPEAPPVPA
jgi:hypothetical protein